MAAGISHSSLIPIAYVWTVAQVEALHQLLGQRSAAPLGEQRVASAQVHTAPEVAGGFAILADTHIAGGDADDAAMLLKQFGGGETGIDFDAQCLGLVTEPTHHIAQGDNVVTVIVDLRRRR